MDKEQESKPNDNHEETIRILKETFIAVFGLTEENVDKVNPFTYGNHDARFRLWVIRNYIGLEDKSKSPLELMFYNSVIAGRSAFRNLDDKGNNDDLPSFKKELKALGIQINQIPSRKGPWI